MLEILYAIHQNLCQNLVKVRGRDHSGGRIADTEVEANKSLLRLLYLVAELVPLSMLGTGSSHWRSYSSLGRQQSDIFLGDQQRFEDYSTVTQILITNWCSHFSAFSFRRW